MTSAIIVLLAAANIINVFTLFRYMDKVKQKELELYKEKQRREAFEQNEVYTHKQEEYALQEKLNAQLNRDTVIIVENQKLRYRMLLLEELLINTHANHELLIDQWDTEDKGNTNA